MWIKDCINFVIILCLMFNFVLLNYSTIVVHVPHNYVSGALLFCNVHVHRTNLIFFVFHMFFLIYININCCFSSPSHDSYHF